MDETRGEARSVIITGGSSGIGLAAARLFAERGWKVFCLGRKIPAPDLLPPTAQFVSADVSKPEELQLAVQKIADQTGKIDVLLSNAGFGISGPIEFTDNRAAFRLMETNFMGSFYAAKAVLPYMRKEGGGRIVFTSSLAAIFPIPFQSFYSSSKAAVNLFAGALDNEVKSFGVRAAVVMPGDVSTGFTAAREKEAAGREVYGSLNEHAVGVMEHDETTGMQPSEIAKILYRAATSPRFRPVWVPGFKYKLLSLLARFLPSRWIYALLGRIYIGK